MDNWKKLMRGIAIGYLLKNYSESFRKDVQIERIRRSGTGKNRYIVEMFKNEYFGILIDMEKKEIHHLNCYAKNRGYDSKKIIDYNINKLNINN